jgi:hypothetical protein
MMVKGVTVVELAIVISLRCNPVDDHRPEKWEIIIALKLSCLAIYKGQALSTLRL